MRDRQLDVTFIRIESFNVDDRYNFMTGLGHFDKDENKFYATNPKQEVWLFYIYFVFIILFSALL